MAVATELALAGAHVVLAVRNTSKGEASARRIREAAAAAGVEASLEVSAIDMASLASVRSFAAGWRASGRPVDLLVNNAGILDFGAGRTARVLTGDGHEQHLQVNFLAPFLLTRELLPALRAGGPAGGTGGRVVFVASDAVKTAPPVDPADLGMASASASYSNFAAYGNSKAALALFAAELNRRKGSKEGAEAVAVTPGFTATTFTRGAPTWLRVLASPMWLLAKSVDAGAAPVLYACVAPATDVSAAWPQDPAVFVTAVGQVEPAAAAIADPAAAAAVWRAGEAALNSLGEAEPRAGGAGEDTSVPKSRRGVKRAAGSVARHP